MASRGSLRLRVGAHARLFLARGAGASRASPDPHELPIRALGTAPLLVLPSAPESQPLADPAASQGSLRELENSRRETSGAWPSRWGGSGGLGDRQAALGPLGEPPVLLVATLAPSRSSGQVVLGPASSRSSLRWGSGRKDRDFKVTDASYICIFLNTKYITKWSLLFLSSPVSLLILKPQACSQVRALRLSPWAVLS